ncbi:MAG: IS481 family transposase [Oscillospiraceae bacterium]|nr:IS481 family transposase [Oscillospiraceae bacterium]
MPWKEETVENQRSSFIARAIMPGCNFSALCREYNITRNTGYKWLKRYLSGEPLSNYSKAPLCRPNKTCPEMEELILSVRIKHPTWGGRKILRYLADKGNVNLPAPSTVASILKRNGFVTPEQSASHVPFQRFQRDAPNDLWQMDFKGHFAMLDGNRCHPLTMKDDHSRNLLCLDAYDNERWESVKASLDRVFRENGLPKTILCDNGAPWGDSHGGYTQFELWMMQMDVLPIHGRPLHPQTQGKEERFHRTLNEDLIKRVPIRNLSHAQELFDHYLIEFNTERPHSALALDVPAKHYRKSPRKVPEKLCEPEYDNGKNLRKVNYKGYISICRHRYYLSENFIDRYMELIPLEGNILGICYGNFVVAKVDLDEEIFVSKRIYRRFPQQS